MRKKKERKVIDNPLQLTKTATAIIDPLSIEDEIAHFCSGNHHEIGDSVSEYHLQQDAVVPEPSISESSLKQATSPTKKKRCKEHAVKTKSNSMTSFL